MLVYKAVLANCYAHNGGNLFRYAPFWVIFVGVDGEKDQSWYGGEQYSFIALRNKFGTVLRGAEGERREGEPGVPARRFRLRKPASARFLPG